MRGSKPVLKMGSKGAAVKELQMLLNAKPSTKPKLIVDGDFGRKTKIMIEAFQRKAQLGVDGVVGKITWAALQKGHEVQELYKYPPGVQEMLADIAIPYIGATEAAGNRMGDDPRMQEIFKADKYAPNGQTDGYPWCCAFVSMCVQKLISASPFYDHVRKPYTPSVHNFRTTWAVQQNCKIFVPNDAKYSPHKGDVVVFTFSHIGIVEKVNRDGIIHTIEGNTNAAGSREGTVVRRKARALPIIRCFIRLPIRKTYNFEKQMCMVPRPAKRSFTLEELLGSLASTP